MVLINFNGIMRRQNTLNLVIKMMSESDIRDYLSSIRREIVTLRRLEDKDNLNDAGHRRLSTLKDYEFMMMIILAGD